MEKKRFITHGVMLLLIIAFTVGFLTAALDMNGNNPQATKSQEKVFIPKEIKTLIQEGLAARQGRQDIPFSIYKNYVLPAGPNSQAIFIFKAKNADLGFVPGAPAAPTDTAQLTQAPASTPSLEAKLNMFLQFLQIDEGNATRIVKEVYVPVLLKEDETSYSPEKEQWYFTSYPLPAGHYLVAMALTSRDLKKVGICYHEFSLLDPAALTESLETTPVFVVKNIEKMDAVETATEVHRGFFTYSLLRIEPNVENLIAGGEPIEIFFYVYGAQVNDKQQHAIQAAYELKQKDQMAIRWENQMYDFALISQPLPLEQTILIKDDKGERKEMRDLLPGKYSLVIDIKDSVGGKTVVKTLDFEITAAGS